MQTRQQYPGKQLAMTFALFFTADLTLEWLAGNICFLKRGTETPFLYMNRVGAGLWQSFKSVSLGLTISNLVCAIISCIEGDFVLGGGPRELSL